MDETEISAQIAKQLGFKHQILHEVDQLQAEHKHAINDYFVNAPFLHRPCHLGLSLYAHQVPELKGANIIDGGVMMYSLVTFQVVQNISVRKHQNTLSIFG